MFPGLSGDSCSYFKIKYLVYQFAGLLESRWLDPASSGDRWIAASDASVRVLFAADTRRRWRFLRFLRSGCAGFFLVRNGQWIAYGWRALPGLGKPPHLPPWTKQLNAHWIFYCHTREEFRGQGHYKRLLAQHVNDARARQAEPLVLCDTLPENFASRRAVLQSGFAPVGVLHAYRIWAPGVSGVVFGGGWRRQTAHLPQMPLAPPRKTSLEINLPR